MKNIASLSRFDLYECMVNSVKVEISGKVCLIRSIAMINSTGNLFTVKANIYGSQKSVKIILNTLLNVVTHSQEC